MKDSKSKELVIGYNLQFPTVQQDGILRAVFSTDCELNTVTIKGACAII